MPWRHREGAVVWLYSFFNLSSRAEWVVNVKPRPLYSREGTGTHRTRGWWWGGGGGGFWTGAGNLASTGVWTPNHPPRSESLYRLLYGKIMKGIGCRVLVWRIRRMLGRDNAGKPRRHWFRVVDVPTQIRTGHHPNIRQKIVDYILGYNVSDGA
jgi:hypothetical protein